MRRTVLFIDFNSFFASVEQHANPLLRGKPVGVIPTMAETTSCIAASNEAKRFGVKTGTGVREARQRCPGIVFVLSDSVKYMDYHRRLVSLCEEEVPVEKICSVDEMYAVFTGAYAEKQPMWEIASNLKRRLAKDFGGPLAGSIGLAPTVFWQKRRVICKSPMG